MMTLRLSPLGEMDQGVEGSTIFRLVNSCVAGSQMDLLDQGAKW